MSREAEFIPAAEWAARYPKTQRLIEQWAAAHRDGITQADWDAFHELEFPPEETGPEKPQQRVLFAAPNGGRPW